MSELPFCKYSGLGNDFIVIDNRCRSFPLLPKTIQTLCHRKTGIGADGVLVLEHSSKALAKMRIFNADGSEAEMCGNGLRCFVKYLAKLGLPVASCHIETTSDLLKCWDLGDKVKVEMPSPKLLHMPLTLNGLNLYHLDTGVPHAVLFVEHFDLEMLTVLGKEMRNHPHFAPRGTNITFLNPLTRNFCTYERGVEAITLACGTGATAAALTLAYTKKSPSPIAIYTLQGDLIEISFREEHGAFKSVTMTGGATYLFSGLTPLAAV